jgi:predicted negative regulator of RcsB-dependent stress response
LWSILYYIFDREELEKELQEVKSLLVKQEEDLKKLRKENSKTFVIALIIMFFAFLAYGIYQMLTIG